jgi:hypothetical protein
MEPENKHMNGPKKGQNAKKFTNQEYNYKAFYNKTCENFI